MVENKRTRDANNKENNSNTPRMNSGKVTAITPQYRAPARPPLGIEVLEVPKKKIYEATQRQ